jgi:predicted NBD/HSP70 family sugar kinase
MSADPPLATQVRWSSASQLITVLRAEPGITRASAAQRLGIGSGTASELVARLRQVCLLDETPAPAQGRGRPSTVLGPHDRGPLVLAADLRATDWRLAVAGLDGIPQIVARRPYGDGTVSTVLDRVAAEIAAVGDRHGGRLRAVAVAAAGTVSGTRLIQFTPRNWNDVELARLADGLASPEVLVGNDATLAGLAEARTGAARSAATALYLIVAQGLGGALVVNGEPLTGGHGAAGEYGHIPFGDPDLVCPCGARGCWDLTVDGRALARALGDPPPDDPVGYLQRRAENPDEPTRNAFDVVATSLGRGAGGLVNLHDPEVVTLGGAAATVRRTAPEAFETAYRGALMDFRKAEPPPVRDAVHGEDGPLHGAVILALDRITTAKALADWAGR